MMILDDGYELQRSGHDMTVVADAIEDEIRAKDDPRYERAAGQWATAGNSTHRPTEEPGGAHIRGTTSGSSQRRWLLL